TCRWSRPWPAAAGRRTASRAATPPTSSASATASAPRPGGGPTGSSSSTRPTRWNGFTNGSPRRWSVSWSRVRGHEGVAEAFDRAWRRGRLAHAYLFTGPPGVGKKLFAVELARALLCEDPPPDRLEACDHCPACAQVEAGTHPDFFTAGRPE